MLPIDNLSPKLHRRFCLIYILIYPIERMTSGNLFLKMVLFSMSISVAQESTRSVPGFWNVVVVGRRGRFSFFHARDAKTSL